MKSSVASRKQRFWALLLAVVMVVGLLPAAGVKADPTIVEIKRNLDDFAKVGKIFSAEDGFIGSYEIEEDAGNLYVSYHDVSGVYLSGGAITENMNDGDEEEPKWIRQTSSGNTYYIYSYEDVADVSEGELYTDPQYYDAHVTDKWLVYPGEDDDIDEYGEDDQVIHLRAIPRYTIKWYPILDEVEWNPDWETFPNEYIPYVPDSQSVDLTGYTGEKEGYKFIGWDHLGDTETDGHWEATYKNNHATIIDSDTCEKFDSYYIEEDDEDPEEVIEEEIHSFSISLRARWIPYYTIKYEKGTTLEICNEIKDPAIDPQEVEMPWLMAEEYEEGYYDEDTDIVELNSDGYSRPGYVFNGWLRYNDKTQQYVPVDYTIEADQDMDPGEELVLYADWVPTYKITFDNNLPEVENYNDKDSIPVPTPISGQVPTDQSDPWIEMPGEPSNDAGDLQHYHLENWYIEETLAKFARNTNYGLISQLLEASEGLLTFTMKGEWIPNEYTFSFHPNRDGVDQPEDINGPYNKAEDIAIPDLAQYENDNLEFIGWVFDPDNVTDDTLITGTKTMKEIVDIYDAEVKRYEKEHLSDFDGQPEVIYEYPWENDNGGVFLTGIWKESYTIKFHKGYQIYHDLGDPKISGVQGIMPGDNDTEEITFVYNPDSTEVFNPYNSEDKFGYSLQGFYYGWEVHKVLLKGEPDGDEGYNWFKEDNTTYVYKEGFSDYNPTGEGNTTYGKLSEYAKEHADEDNVLHIVAWWNRDNAAYKITFDNMDPSKDINKATIPATDPILGYYWNTVDEQAVGGVPQDPPTGGNEQAETYVYIPPVVVNPNVNDPFGTVEMPMAPQSEKHDPRYYNFLGWKIKKETDEAEDEEIKLYLPQKSYYVKDLFEEAGLTWVSTYKIDPDLYLSQMFDDENYYLDVIPMEAVWEAKTYDIIFDANKGDKDITLNHTSLEEYNLNGVRFTETKAITYPDLKDANDNYGVIGWVLDSTGTTKDFPINAEDKVKDIVLKADVLDDNGDSKYIKIIDLGADPAVGGDNDNELPSDGQITLYALWDKYVTVTYDANGANGTVPAVQKGFAGDIKNVSDNTGNLTKEGYTFVGWNTSKTGEDETAYAAGDEIALERDKDIVLYAQWEENNYLVRFNKNSDKASGNMDDQVFAFDEGDKALSENKFIRTGYTFTGWATSATGAKVYDDKQEVGNLTNEDDGIVTLYAVWTPITYTVVFDPNPQDKYEISGSMGSQEFTYDVAQNLTANAFKNPGYYFAGWATTADGEAKYADKASDNNLTDKNGETVTLYAVWTQSAVVTLKFYPDGGVINDDDSELGYYEVSGPEGIIINAPGEEVVTRNGYIFVGWEDENEDVTYKPGDPINLYEGELYATWTPKPYVVVYDYNTPESDLKIEDCVNEYYDDEEALVPLYMNVDVDTAEYKFLGWSVDPESTEAEFDKEPVTLKAVVDAAISAETISNDDVATLYGVWEKQKYTVKFDLNGHGEGSLDVDQLTKDYYYYGDSVDEPDSEPSDIGYDFKGWYCIEEGLEDDPTIWDFDKYTVEGNMTLQADWTPKNYDFVLVTAVEAVDALVVIEGKSYEDNVKFPTLTDAKGEYTFVGWVLVLNEDSTAADFAAAQDIPVSTVVGKVSGVITNGKITLYALWTKKPTHQVRWLGDNDELLYEATVIDGDDEPEYRGQTPKKENYDFDQWEKVPSENGNDVIYKAKFKEKPSHKVIWVDDNGEPLYEVTVLDEDLEEPKYDGPTPTKENYEFDDWADPEEDENGNTVIKAKFNPKKFGIKFVDYDGRDLKEDAQYDYGTKAADIAKPADPTRAGYTFTGWTPAIADVTGNATYTATYEINKYTVTWKNEDGTVLETDKDVEYGTDPKYDGATPTKAADDTYTYTFKGWKPALDKVTKDVTYTAEFNKVAKGNGGNTNPNPPAPTYYTITWQNYDGTTLGTSRVEAGKVPAYNGATPSRASDDDFVYSFSTWTPNVVAATGDATYKAQFNASAIVKPTPTATPTPTPTPAAPQVYNIEYYEELEDGTVVQLKKTMNPDTYTYGVGAVIKYGIDKEGYKFNGWYSKRSKKYVDKVSETTKGTVKLYARFLPIDDGNGNGGNESAGTPDSEFGILCVRLTDYTEDSMTLMWDLMEGVDGYDIFGSRCNSKDVIRPYEPIDSVDANTDHYVANDLLKQTYYKFYVRAYILVNNEKRYITTSINVHGVTLNEKYGVADDIIVNKVVVKGKKSKTKYDSERDGYVEEINITMKVGQTLKIVASEYNADGKEIRAHRPISFESSKPDILKVGKKKNHKYGVEVKDKANTYKSHTIFANAAGECTIYVFAQNGLYTKVNVTVKAAK
ncbi:MAG: InlB B-repeat-containing protein [Lachnospiraceae bacterium]|nr:InlB B-repeat-containing protein [Lachnospiraceae bacterium]